MDEDVLARPALSAGGTNGTGSDAVNGVQVEELAPFWKQATL